jgi:potassium/hydrogen antiporter
VALGAEPVLAVAGLVLLAGVLADLAFRSMRVPDVMVLILAGVLIGYAFNATFLATLAPLLGTVAILVILFDGGLEIRIDELRTGVTSGVLLAVVVFSLTSLLAAFVGYLWLELTSSLAALFGMMFGGAGVAIVIPLVRSLGVSSNAVTIVSVEAAVSDVLVVLGVYGLSSALALHNTRPEGMAGALALAFGVAIVAGLGAGWLWSRVLAAPWSEGFQYPLTLAAVLLLHVVVEHAHGNGPLAVLAFGLVIGNSTRAVGFAQRTRGSRQAQEPTVPVFGAGPLAFHHQVVFIVRAFFFVALGATLEVALLRSPIILWVGVMVAVAVAAARWLGTLLVVRGLPPHEGRAVAFMFPLGLAAAALSQVPHSRFQLPGTEHFPAYAMVAIVATNLLAGLLVAFAYRPPPRLAAEGRSAA